MGLFSSSQNSDNDQQTQNTRPRSGSLLAFFPTKESNSNSKAIKTPATEFPGTVAPSQGSGGGFMPATAAQMAAKAKRMSWITPDEAMNLARAGSTSRRYSAEFSAVRPTFSGPTAFTGPGAENSITRASTFKTGFEGNPEAVPLSRHSSLSTSRSNVEVPTSSFDDSPLPELTSMSSISKARKRRDSGAKYRGAGLVAAYSGWDT